MGKTTKESIKWVLGHGCVVTLAVLGVVFDYSMAANVFKFLAWLINGSLILCALSDKAAANLRRTDGRMWRPTLAVHIGVACLLAAYGWFGYATLVAFGGIGVASVYSEEDGEAADV